MAVALKYAVIWMPICGFLSVAAVSCGKYHTEANRLEHEEWLIRQEHCAKRGGMLERTWGNWTCEVKP